jgi:PAS domain S-box-containing protein
MPKMPESTLLLVDDKAENLIALEAVLSGDYRLLRATSGAEAIEIAENNHVDAILLDIQMPGLDGYETARRIKQVERCKTVPIIFITAIFKENPAIRKGYEVGAVDYFTKPFDPEILKMKVGIYATFRHKEALLHEREKRIRETEELLKAGRKLAAVLESLPVGVIIADTQGRVVQTNDSILKIWKSIEPSQNDSYGEFLQWWRHDGKRFKDAFARALETGQSTHNEIIEIRCFDGTPKTVLSSASPLRGLDDAIVGAAAVVQDISEHRKIEEDMEKRIMSLITLGVGFEQRFTG